VVVASLLVASAAYALAVPRIDWWILAGGGGSVTNDGTSLSGTLGQWSASSSSNGNLQLRSGFWAGAAPTPLPPHFDVFLPILKRQA
jgi:hypothetical protein